MKKEAGIRPIKKGAEFKSDLGLRQEDDAVSEAIGAESEIRVGAENECVLEERKEADSTPRVDRGTGEERRLWTQIEHFHQLDDGLCKFQDEVSKKLDLQVQVGFGNWAARTNGAQKDT
ncbi:hypothetical protein Salat_1713100 [Sesamum alatum]|uniref:Uncharacterized protein n=1 Tax=Sesamum alatum TaxID=300844 RepID=A0AAE2CK70_9LAMI|nr:hypothetical protein Salat_1713100 [Sesamum alatum]